MMRRPAISRRQHGMTLVEVLVALAIVSAVAASIMVLIAQNTRFVAASESQLLAGIAVDKVLVDALARVDNLDRGVDQEEVEVGGHVFFVTKTVTDLGVEKLVRIDIAVSDREGGQTLASATTIKSEDRS